MTFKSFCFSFKGRINRAQYWIYVLVAAVIHVILGAMGSASEAMLVVALVLFLLIVYADLAVSAKRLHDTNRSGGYLFIGLIPILGPLILLYMCGIVQGDEGENDYGPPPAAIF